MTAGSDPRRCLPYPELVEPEGGGGRPYRVVEVERVLGASGGGMVDKGERWMAVPLEPAGRSTCRHELAHVAWSPVRLPRVPFDVRVLAAVEDARINLGLARIGLPVVPHPESGARVRWLLERDAKARDPFALWVRSVASVGTALEGELRGWLAVRPDWFAALIGRHVARVREALERARRRAGACVAPFGSADGLARRLAAELRVHGLLDARGMAPGSWVAAGCLGESRADRGIPGASGADPGSAGSEAERCGEVVPGRLRVRTAPLEVALRARGGLPAWRPGAEGSVVRYVHRFATDGAIFRRRTRVAGGTVLVDHSGSMGLHVRDLDRLLLATPRDALVAVYSGHRGEGELRIVAARGRRAAREHLRRFGAGNVVDVPALVWLARRPEPRVWISDGGVTGVDDRPSDAMDRRVRVICGRSGIRRVRSLDEAVRMLGGTRPRRRPARPRSTDSKTAHSGP